MRKLAALTLLILLSLGNSRQRNNPVAVSLLPVPLAVPIVRTNGIVFTTNSTYLLAWCYAQDTNVVGYKVWSGPDYNPSDSTKCVTVGNTNVYVVTVQPTGQWYRVTAYDANGLGSSWSTISTCVSNGYANLFIGHPLPPPQTVFSCGSWSVTNPPSPSFFVSRSNGVIFTGSTLSALTTPIWTNSTWQPINTGR